VLFAWAKAAAYLVFVEVVCEGTNHVFALIMWSQSQGG